MLEKKDTSTRKLTKYIFNWHTTCSVYYTYILVCFWKVYQYFIAYIDSFVRQPMVTLYHNSLGNRTVLRTKKHVLTNNIRCWKKIIIFDEVIQGLIQRFRYHPYVHIEKTNKDTLECQVFCSHCWHVVLEYIFIVWLFC